MKQNNRIYIFPATALVAALLALGDTARAQSTGTRTAASARNPRTPVSESVRSGTVIAPDGQVAVTSIDRKWDSKSGTGTINEAAVTPDGKISSRASNLTRDPDGTIVERGTFTDFDGRSANYTETTKRTGAGLVTVGRMVDADGNVATYETTAARAGRNQTKLTKVITHADGTKETRVEMLAPAKTMSGS